MALLYMPSFPGGQFHLEMLYLEPQKWLSCWGCEQAGEGWFEFLILPKSHRVCVCSFPVSQNLALLKRSLYTGGVGCYSINYVA